MTPLNGFLTSDYNEYFYKAYSSGWGYKLDAKEYTLYDNQLSKRTFHIGNYIDGSKDGFHSHYNAEFDSAYLEIMKLNSYYFSNKQELNTFLKENLIDETRDHYKLRNSSNQIFEGYYLKPKPLFSGNYKKGIKDGMFTYYNNIGRISKEINWKNGEKDGLRRFYYDNIEKNKYEIHYNKKEKEGEYRYWYENDQLKVSGSYKNDKIHGKWKLFYKNGRTESEKLFKNGKLITEICYDKKSNKQINCNSSWLRKNVDERFDLKFLQKRKEYINNYVFRTLRFIEANSMVFDINKAKQKLDKYSIEYTEGFNGLAKLSNEGDSSIVFSYFTNENEYDIMKYNVKFEDSKERLISVFKNKTKELGDNSTIQELIEHEVSYIARYYDVNKIDNNDELSNNSRKGILGEIIIKAEDW
jgi:antitoxin component YwqK of YwqJK toxin-antitoxin module